MGAVLTRRPPIDRFIGPHREREDRLAAQHTSAQMRASLEILPMSISTENSRAQPTSTDHTEDDNLPLAPLNQPVAKGWTMGNSHNLVEGAEPEPRWVSVAWFVVPTGVAIALLFAMVQLFGS